ncbi:MAG: methionyl-tRNA formyltransferase [Magnetococcales bacterium]|nr:methionyl-tRNA formyltransferase [Magnetococcales bacterium]MBF0150224.1 methionyl-tRNA formyltransferase [Magnetococcales bacterium]
MTPLKIVFMGTPDFAVPSLAALISSPDTVVGVFTQPDRVAGRGLRLQPSPVKQHALAHGLTVHQPTTLRHPDAVTLLQSLQPDLIVVTAYGLLLPPAILAIPGHGCINVHASLLPRWRGAAPLHRAILAGDRETGVTIMAMEAGLDTGPILAMDTTPIDDTMTGGRLHDQLAEQGARLLTTTLAALKMGTLKPQPQPTTGITYAEKLTRDDEWIHWNQEATLIHRQIRALNPWPGARTTFQGHTLKIIAAHPAERNQQGQPGEIITLLESGFEVACGQGSLIVTRVTPSGKKTMSAAAWIHGRHLTTGNLLGLASN